MSTYNLQITTDEYEMADCMVIDEGGVDLKLAGDTIIGASFVGLDIFEIMHDLLPEHWEFPEYLPKAVWAGELEKVREGLKEATAEEVEEASEIIRNTIYGSLVTLAIMKGWAKN